MPLDHQDLTLADLKTLFYGALHESSTDDYFGATLVEHWLNCGLMEMFIEGYVIEDEIAWTTTVGKRDYAPKEGSPASLSVARWVKVSYDGRGLEFRSLSDLDFESDSTGPPSCYTLWRGKILLGPNPPSEALELRAYVLREPRVMVDDTDRPEIPNRYRHYLVDYARAEAFWSDGKRADGDRFFQKFEAGSDRHHKEILYPNRGEFRVVRVVE